MRLKKVKPYHMLIFTCLLSIASLIYLFAVYGGNVQTGTVIPVRIIGRYAIDGRETEKLSEDIAIGGSTLHTVTASGRFSTGIPEGWVLMLRLDNIKISIKINGTEVYCSGDGKSIPGFTKTAGNMWGFYISPGIMETDKVEITLQNVYAGTITNVFEEFFDGLSYGHGFELYQTMIRDKMPLILFGFIILVTGMIVFMVSAVAGLLKAPGMGRSVALACVAMTGGVWISIDGGYPYVSLLFKNPLLFNAIDVLQIFVISVVLMLFTFTCLEKAAARKIAEFILEASLVLLTVAIVIQDIGLYDLYEIQDWAVIVGFSVVLASVLLLGYEALILKHRQTLIILLLWLPLFISGFLEIINYFLRFMPERTTVKFGFALSVLLQFIQLVRVIRGYTDRMKEAARIEYELLQSRMSVMLSQIQPHFLFNSLNDIRFLYRESPERAEQAMISFTRYLRGNMDSLNQIGLIPFEQELNHVQNYVAIEKMRFGNKLTVIFELGCREFLIPVLTIQPLVENAIRHGINKKQGEGTVIVRTFEDAHNYFVEICDDGPGFDPSFSNNDGRTHNGINNVHMRLQSMCGGSLDVKSRIGGGTTSLARIPKGWLK